LYPGRNSTNLTGLPTAERQQLFDPNKKLRLFVIDGTWAKAKKTVRLSQNLQALPKICFSPSRPSNFKVRKQPQEHCFSTIEAIHEVIDLLGNSFGYDPASRQHDALLEVFDVMVQRQLDFMRIADTNPEKQNYRRFNRSSLVRSSSVQS
jgi:DTW domain-containing protein YfiP